MQSSLARVIVGCTEGLIKHTPLGFSSSVPLSTGRRYLTSSTPGERVEKKSKEEKTRFQTSPPPSPASRHK